MRIRRLHCRSDGQYTRLILLLLPLVVFSRSGEQPSDHNSRSQDQQRAAAEAAGRRGCRIFRRAGAALSNSIIPGVITG